MSAYGVGGYDHNEALAEPNTIVIAESTRRQIGALFELADLGPRSLKRFEETILPPSLFLELAAVEFVGSGKGAGGDLVPPVYPGPPCSTWADSERPVFFWNLVNVTARSPSQKGGTRCPARF